MTEEHIVHIVEHLDDVLEWLETQDPTLDGPLIEQAAVALCRIATYLRVEATS